MGTVAGLVLAAGGGSRFGGPKALARAADGEAWVSHAVAALSAGGCGEVVVVLGAAAAEARPLVPPATRLVVAERWADGMAASLTAGLAALPERRRPRSPSSTFPACRPAGGPRCSTRRPGPPWCA